MIYELQLGSQTSPKAFFYFISAHSLALSSLAISNLCHSLQTSGPLTLRENIHLLFHRGNRTYQIRTTKLSIPNQHICLMLVRPIPGPVTKELNIPFSVPRESHCCALDTFNSLPIFCKELSEQRQHPYYLGGLMRYRSFCSDLRISISRCGIK